jgi:hypothetical protein
VQFDPGPLEAALFQHAARGRVGDARAGAKLGCVGGLEGVVDDRAHRLGGKTVAPELDPQPAILLGVRFAGFKPGDTDRHAVVRDQEACTACATDVRDHQRFGIAQRERVRQPAGILGDAGVVGEARNRFYVRERRATQGQPLGLEDDDTRPR